MPKKPMTASPLPVPPLTPIQEPQPEMAYLVDPVTEPATVTPEPVTLVTEPSPKVEPKVETKSPRLARFIPTHGFPIRHFNGGIVFYPNQPSAEVPVDAWLENQIQRGILKEV